MHSPSAPRLRGSVWEFSCAWSETDGLHGSQGRPGSLVGFRDAVERRLSWAAERPERTDSRAGVPAASDEGSKGPVLCSSARGSTAETARFTPAVTALTRFRSGSHPSQGVFGLSGTQFRDRRPQPCCRKARCCVVKVSESRSQGIRVKESRYPSQGVRESRYLKGWSHGLGRWRGYGILDCIARLIALLIAHRIAVMQAVSGPPA